MTLRAAACCPARRGSASRPALPRAAVLALLMLARVVLAAEPGEADRPSAGSAGSVSELWQAQFLRSDAKEPPSDDAPWQVVDLPDRWTDPARYRAGLIGWYRFVLPQQKAPDVRFGIYLWRFNMAVEVWLNGELLRTTGRFEEPVTRDWNHPQLVEVPPHSWRAGRNVLDVRLRAYPRYGALAPVFVGPLPELAPAWRLRSFVQNDLSTGLLVLTLTVALIALAFWLPRKRDTLYLYFALSSLAYSLFSLNLVVRDVPMAGETWWWITHSGIEWWVVLLSLFAHRLVGVRPRRLEAALIGYAVLATLVNAAVDLPTFAVVCNVFHLVSQGIALYLVVLLLRAWRRTRRTELLVFGLGMIGISLLGVHDLAMNSVVRVEMWRNGFFLLNLGAPVVFLVMLWHLARRYVEALQGAELTNEDLVARIGEARAELDASYAERRELERAQAAAEERDRIQRDLHDDVGARLLSLVYAAPDEATRGLARETLRELRDLVSQAGTEVRSLAEFAQAMGAEVEERARTAGLAFTAAGAVHHDADLSAVQVWHLSRIVREAVSNVLRHAGAGRLHLAVQRDASDAAVLIVVEDDGRGLDAAPDGGRGLGNIRQRVAELGGEVLWCAGAAGAGCRMQVRIPLPA